MLSITTASVAPADTTPGTLVISIVLDADCNEVELPSVLESVVDLLKAGGVNESSIVSADINCGSIVIDLTMDSAESVAAVEALVTAAGGFNVLIDGATFEASLAAKDGRGGSSVDDLSGNQQDGGKGTGGGAAGGVVGTLLAVFIIVGGAYFYKRRKDEANNPAEVVQSRTIGAANYTFGDVSAAVGQNEAAASSTAHSVEYVPRSAMGDQSAAMYASPDDDGYTAGDSVNSMPMSSFAKASSGSMVSESQYHEATATENSDAQYHMATPTNGSGSSDAQYHMATPTGVDAQYHMATPSGPADYRVVAGALASASSPANDYALPEGYLTMGNGGTDGDADAGRNSMTSETSFGISAQGSFRVSSVRRVNPIRIESDAPGEMMPSLMGTVMEEDSEVGKSGPSGTSQDPAALPRMERRVSLVDDEELLFVTRVSEAGLPHEEGDDGGGDGGDGGGGGSDGGAPKGSEHSGDVDVIAGTRTAPQIDENAFVRKAGGGFRLASVRKTQAATVAKEADAVGAAAMEVAVEA